MSLVIDDYTCDYLRKRFKRCCHIGDMEKWFQRRHGSVSAAFSLCDLEFHRFDFRSEEPTHPVCKHCARIAARKQKQKAA